MAAFVVFIRDKTRDQSEMDTWIARAGPSLAGRGVSLVGAGEVKGGPGLELVSQPRRSGFPA